MDCAACDVCNHRADPHAERSEIAAAFGHRSRRHANMRIETRHDGRVNRMAKQCVSRFSASLRGGHRRTTRLQRASDDAVSPGALGGVQRLVAGLDPLFLGQAFDKA